MNDESLRSSLHLDDLPKLSTEAWARVGAGAALAVVGSGLVSIGTLLRLALVAGGGIMAYRAWNDGRGPSRVDAGASGDMDRTMAEGAGGASTRSGATSATRSTGSAGSTGSTAYGNEPGPRDLIAPDRDEAPRSLIDADTVPPVDLRGG